MAKKRELTYCKIKDLKPFDGNPRKIEPSELAKLRRSLRDFGFVDPVIARRSDKMIIGGHQRIEAAKAEGWSEPVPVIFLDDLDDDRAAMLNVALNKISGEWDWPKMGDLFAEFDTGDIDLEMSGFDLDEIAGLMNGLDTTLKEKSVEISESWQIVCEVDSEIAQKNLYNKLISEGIKCRLLIL